MAEKTKRRLHDGDNLGPQTRSITLAIRTAVDAAGKRTVPGLDVEARTLEISFSSEEPVARWFGSEVLSHDADAPDFSRLNDGAPMLFNHNMDDILGVVEKAWIGADKRGYALVRFANTPRGQEMLGLVLDGIVRNVSFMYRVDKYRIDSEQEDPYYDDDAIYTATRWLAYEVSMVSVPADQTVGVGRSAHVQEQPVVVQTSARQPQASNAASAAPSTTGDTTMFLKRAPVLQSAAETQTSAGGSGAAATTPAAPIDLVAVERQRVSDIVALGRKHNITMEKTHEMISAGVDIATARGIVLDGLLGKQGAVASLGDGLDMTDKEKRNYSLIRAVQAVVSNNWQSAGFEREVSQALAKRMNKAETNSFFMPTDLPFAPDEKHARTYSEVMGKKQTRAAYQVGAAAQGGNLVATNLMADNFIEVLRNASVTAQLGARYLTDLVGNVDIPRQNGATNLSWVGESGAPGESASSFDKVSLKPKTITAWSLISRLMLLQSTPAIEMLARADLLAQCALGIDLAAMSGSGAGGQPTGIVNQSGVCSVVGGANGAALSFDHIIQMYSGPMLANAPQANLGFAINSKAFGYLSTLKSTTGQYLWMPQGGIAQAPGDTLRGYPYAVSNQLRSNLTKGTATNQCSELIYGNWLELLIGMWGVMEIAVNPYDTTGFKNGDVVLRVMQTCDIGVRHGASFAVMTDALTPAF